MLYAVYTTGKKHLVYILYLHKQLNNVNKTIFDFKIFTIVKYHTIGLAIGDGWGAFKTSVVRN